MLFIRDEFNPLYAITRVRERKHLLDEKDEITNKRDLN